MPKSSQPTLDDDTTPDDDTYLTILEPNNEFVDVNEENLYIANAPKIETSHEGNTLESEFDKDYEEDGFVGKDPIQPPILLLLMIKKTLLLSLH